MDVCQLKIALSAFDSIPRVDLGFFPTPLHKLQNLSNELGISLYMKRDDLTGSNPFGGNKTRKLEFLIAKALSEGCDHVFTYGVAQSNHAMQTAWAAAKYGLKPILYLSSLTPYDPSAQNFNLQAAKLYGAEVHVVEPKEGTSPDYVWTQAKVLASEHQKRLLSEGHQSLDIPTGGANAVGSLGYVKGFLELASQESSLDLHFDRIYHASGSCGTLAGILAGKQAIEHTASICPVMVIPPKPGYLEKTSSIANESLTLLKAASIQCGNRISYQPVSPESISLDCRFSGATEPCPMEKVTAAIHKLAMTEGLLIDSGYNGKVLAAILQDVSDGRIPKGASVLFLNTGGITGVFGDSYLFRDIPASIVH